MKWKQTIINPMFKTVIFVALLFSMIHCAKLELKTISMPADFMPNLFYSKTLVILPTSKARDQEATALLNWGFSAFKNYKIFGKGDVVEVGDVWNGEEESVPLIASQDIILTLPRSQRKDLQAKIIYDSPLAAPLKAGDTVGSLEVTVPEKGVLKTPLYVGKDGKLSCFV